MILKYLKFRKNNRQIMEFRGYLSEVKGIGYPKSSNFPIMLHYA